jgi:hypothetical protein
MTKTEATKLLNIYGKAWVTQDPELILTIFTEDATYNDPHEPENHGHEGIRKYWQSKVVDGEKDISFKLLNVWVDRETVIAEWTADFIDTKRQLKIILDEVAILTVRGDKFSSLREFYKSVKTPL